MTAINIVCLQYDIAWENKEANHQIVLEMLAEKLPAAGSLLVLPEMFDTGFSMNVPVTADDDQALSANFLSSLAARLDCWVLAGIVRKQGERAYNQALLFDRSAKQIASYNKNYLFSPGQENLHFLPGEGVSLFEIDGFKIAPFICYDLRFPELFRRAVRQGAEMFVVMANWPEQRTAHWCSLLQARAIENQAYVVAVNRSGSDPHNKYPGRSQIIDPWGRILTDAGADKMQMQLEVDKSQLLKYRQEFPVLQDMK